MNYEHAIEILKALEATPENVEVNELSEQGNGLLWRKPHPHEINISQLNELNSPRCFRIKPGPRKVPFGPEDIKCNMWFRYKHWDAGEGFRANWRNSSHVAIHDSTVSYEELQADYTYQLDGGSGDLPCEKEVAG